MKLSFYTLIVGVLWIVEEALARFICFYFIFMVATSVFDDDSLPGVLSQVKNYIAFLQILFRLCAIQLGLVGF